MNKSIVLIVEDDPAVRNLIAATLETHHYKCLIAPTGEAALLEATSHSPDIILLDLGLPDMDGIVLIGKLRAGSRIPIIVVSARSEDVDKIAALDAGADDYLTKPFSGGELLARLRVAQRRVSYEKFESLVFVNGDLKIDYTAGSAYLGGTEIHLTPIEYKLICLLSQNAGKVLTHTFLAKEIWGSTVDGDVSSLRVFMATLRKKIETDPAAPKYLETHVGVGYRMIKL